MDVERTDEQELERLAAALAGADSELPDEAEIKALLEHELEKDEEQMDTALVDACCAALAELHGRMTVDAREPLPTALRRRMRYMSILRTRVPRFALRATAVAACVMLVCFAADVAMRHRPLRITQSGDAQQAVIDRSGRGGEAVSHAGANADDPFDRVYLAPSLDALWQYAGYSLPLPQNLPVGWQAVQAYLLPMGSVDMITVAYADGDACVKVEYWYDKSRESVLLGYESWPDREDVSLSSGNTVMRFHQTDENAGLLHAAFIAPHLTCALEGRGITEADFAAVLESFGEMRADAPPKRVYSDPDDPLARQPRVTEYAAPQLHFYTLSDMTACVRMDVPLPDAIPEDLSFSDGVYIYDDDWDRVDLRYETADGRGLNYGYEVYSPEMLECMSMGMEQNEEGRYVTLQNGRTAYIACNVDAPFGLITGERSMISVHLTGYGEQELIEVLNAISSLPKDF